MDLHQMLIRFVEPAVTIFVAASVWIMLAAGLFRLLSESRSRLEAIKSEWRKARSPARYSRPRALEEQQGAAQHV